MTPVSGMVVVPYKCQRCTRLIDMVTGWSIFLYIKSRIACFFCREQDDTRGIYNVYTDLLKSKQAESYGAVPLVSTESPPHPRLKDR